MAIEFLPFDLSSVLKRDVSTVKIIRIEKRTKKINCLS